MRAGSPARAKAAQGSAQGIQRRDCCRTRNEHLNLEMPQIILLKRSPASLHFSTKTCLSSGLTSRKSSSRIYYSSRLVGQQLAILTQVTTAVSFRRFRVSNTRFLPHAAR